MRVVSRKFPDWALSLAVRAGCMCSAFEAGEGSVCTSFGRFAVNGAGEYSVGGVREEKGRLRDEDSFSGGGDQGEVSSGGGDRGEISVDGSVDGTIAGDPERMSVIMSLRSCTNLFLSPMKASFGSMLPC